MKIKKSENEKIEKEKLEKEKSFMNIFGNDSRIKTRVIATFVAGMLFINFTIAMLGGILAHFEMANMRMKYGEDFVPSYKVSILRMFIVTVTVLVVVAGIIYRRMDKEFIRPVRILSAAARKIAEGELNFELDYPFKRQSELKSLYSDFEYMRKKLKEQAEEKIENEERNRQLISNIAHDLRTPLTTIQGYSEGLIDGIAATNERQTKYYKTIRNKAEEMDRLLNELSFYTKISQSNIPYNFIKLDINAYINDCDSEMRDELEEKGFIFTYKNELPENTQIIADPEQLRRVIGNIIGNSVKYNDNSKGEICISLKDADNFVIIEIADNGPGIEAKVLPQIFDRFYRSDKSRSSSTGGSGIGLSIVKKIVEDHGGRVWASSVPEEGLTIYIELRKYV